MRLLPVLRATLTLSPHQVVELGAGPGLVGMAIAACSEVRHIAVDWGLMHRNPPHTFAALYLPHTYLSHCCLPHLGCDSLDAAPFPATAAVARSCCSHCSHGQVKLLPLQLQPSQLHHYMQLQPLHAHMSNRTCPRPRITAGWPIFTTTLQHCCCV